MESVTIDWGYTIFKIIIYFMGIFVVLGFLQVIIQIMGRILIADDVRGKVKTEAETKADAGEIPADQVAAVGMALFLHDQNR